MPCMIEKTTQVVRNHEPHTTRVARRRSVRAARRVCVNEAGIDRRRISFMGYWKAGQAES